MVVRHDDDDDGRDVWATTMPQHTFHIELRCMERARRRTQVCSLHFDDSVCMMRSKSGMELQAWFVLLGIFLSSNAQHPPDLIHLRKSINRYRFYIRRPSHWRVALYWNRRHTAMLARDPQPAAQIPVERATEPGAISSHSIFEDGPHFVSEVENEQESSLAAIERWPAVTWRVNHFVPSAEPCAANKWENVFRTRFIILRLYPALAQGCFLSAATLLDLFLLSILALQHSLNFHNDLADVPPDIGPNSTAIYE
ncbi:hypothetical protein DFH29DRAFT_877193 [Suillus ampliporus]|nr:hypothetical protein DFH29DRAFT_877193 [Suillus ampliporus]